MFCKYCGKEINDSDAFCSGCGKATKEPAPKKIPVPSAPAASTAPEPPKKKKKLKGPLGCLVWSIAIMFLCVSCMGLFLSDDETPSEPALSKDEYIAQCSEIAYQDLARNPDAHKDEYFTVTGEVIQVLEDNNHVTLRLNITKQQIGDMVYYEDTILVLLSLEEDADRILVEDVITIYGQCQGLETYSSIFGESISIPRIDAEYYDRLS